MTWKYIASDKTSKSLDPHRVKTVKDSIGKCQVSKQRLSNGIIGLNANQIVWKKNICIVYVQYMYMIHVHTYARALLIVFLTDFVNIGHFFSHGVTIEETWLLAIKKKSRKLSFLRVTFWTRFLEKMGYQ